MPVDIIAMLDCHLVMYLPDPQAHEVMYASVYTLSFEVGVVNILHQPFRI